jgi:integration host factor subunit alpha
MPAITKAHMVEPLLAKNIHTKGESAQVIETLLEIIKQTLEQCGEVLVSGFGTFPVNEKHQLRGRNPQTGQSILLPPRIVMTFNCSWIFREKTNQEKGQEWVSKLRR